MEIIRWLLILTLAFILAGTILPLEALVVIAVALGTIILIATMLFAVFWLLPYIPFAIESLANDPNIGREEGEMHRTYEPSTFGFFTGLQPGQVKIIEREERFVRCIMRYDGYTFAGEKPGANIPRNSERYWEVVESLPNGRDFYPIVQPWKHDIDENGNPTTRDPKWWEPLFHRWCVRVYNITGFVFTGIYPYQTVRIYPMDRYVDERDDEGRFTTKIKEDYSDHYRVEDFQFPVAVYKADTQDMIPVNITLNFVGRVANPYEVAYATDDDWGARLLSVITNAVTEHTRITPIQELLAAKNKTQSRKLVKAVLAVEVKPKRGESEEDVATGTRAFGMKAIDAYVHDISPVDPQVAIELGGLALARVYRDSQKERAVGDAALVSETAKAAREQSEYGELALRMQGNINTAKAAGDKGIVILGDNAGSIDPLTAKVERNTRKDS